MSDEKKKKAAKPAEEVVEKPAKKEAEPEKVMTTSSDVAKQLGIRPTILRRYLRTLPRFQDSGYTRYKWDPSDPKDKQFLDDIKVSYEKYTKSAEEKKAARDAERAEAAAKKKSEAGDAPVKEKKAKSKKAPEPEPVEDEEEEIFDEEDGDSEGEELE
jgi:hypothetical protein